MGETPALVKATVGEYTLSAYNSMDVDILLERWCNKEYQVSHNLYWILFSFSKTNVLDLNILYFNCVGIFCVHEAIEVIEPRASLHRVEELCQGYTRARMFVCVYIYMYICIPVFNLG